MCDTCQDCDNITLPTGATGVDGAAGPAGNDGADGNNGVGVLYNDLVPGMVEASTFSLFSNDKVYSVPAGTLAANGDKIEVVAMFTTTSDSDLFIHRGEYQVLVGGTDMQGPYFYKGLPQVAAGVPGYHLRVRLDISRISSTSLMVHSDNYLAVSSGQTVYQGHFSNTALTVADLDSNNLVIQLKGSTVTGDTTSRLICNQLNVNKLIQ